MDIGEFFELTWAIIIVAVSLSVSSAKKKAKERQRHMTARPVAASDGDDYVPQPAAPKAARPEPAQVLPPLPKAEPLKAAPVQKAPLQPTIHAHVADPDCETHDVPGSLGVTSMEGKDLCHQEQMEELERSSFMPVTETTGMKLEWTGENMVKAFVMQEVLTRPSQRRRPAGR